jgi:hypothetical protein
MRAKQQTWLALVVLSLVASGAIGQDAPKITIPADLKPVAGYVRFTPDTNANTVVYIPLDEAYPFPSEELRDGRRFILPVMGLKDGTYRFVAVATKDDVPTIVSFSVKVGDATQPPPTKPTDPVPPVKPTDPPTADGKVFFLLVRPDGPAQADYVRILSDPAWDEHRKAGIVVKDKTFSDSRSIYTAPSGTPLPFVVTLRSGKTESIVISGPVALPTTSDGIRKLAEGTK